MIILTTKDLKSYIGKYITHVRPQSVISYNDFRKFMSDSTKSDAEKAKKLILGHHQWYFPNFHKAEYGKLLNEVELIKPWNKSYSHCKNFEDLYKDVEKWLKRMWIGQLTIYDVALRIAVCLNVPHLYPKYFVYIHAKPLTAYKDLVNRGIIKTKNPLKHDGTVPFEDLSPFFPGLTAIEIEDILCYIAKKMNIPTTPSKSKPVCFS